MGVKGPSKGSNDLEHVKGIAKGGLFGKTGLFLEDPGIISAGNYVGGGIIWNGGLVKTKRTTKKRVGCDKRGNCCVKSMLLRNRSMCLPYETQADCARRKRNKNSSANGTSGRRTHTSSVRVRLLLPHSFETIIPVNNAMICGLRSTKSGHSSTPGPSAKTPPILKKNLIRM